MCCVPWVGCAPCLPRAEGPAHIKRSSLTSGNDGLPMGDVIVSVEDGG